ncbi:MAG TPA: ATP synthase subunit I [Candidatus Acidoferrum sp.]|nr:ATP synthase subunit I [Candidatus Acidoferrum sp.]
MGSQQRKRPRFLKLENVIARLTLILGVLVAAPVGYLYGWSWAVGVFIGSVLAWVSFRWLKQGVEALALAATAQAKQQKVQVPVATYFKAVFRYGLIALSIYVTFKCFNVPILSMIVGLFALGAAATLASLYEILRPVD